MPPTVERRSSAWRKSIKASCPSLGGKTGVRAAVACRLFMANYLICLAGITSGTICTAEIQSIDLQPAEFFSLRVTGTSYADAIAQTPAYYYDNTSTGFGDNWSS